MSQDGTTGLDRRVGYAAKRLQQTLRVAADAALRPCGLTMPQYAVLSVLAEQSDLSSSELARRCFVTRQTMNELLAGLLAAGLVIRTAHAKDGRIQQAKLTAAGEKAARRADVVVAGVEEQMTAGLSDTQRHRLLDLLVTCAGNLEDADTTRP